MATATQLHPFRTPTKSLERRVVLFGVPWSTYVVMRDSLDSSGVRMTYLEGTLEIMSPSPEHEVDKTQIARFVELFCLERDIPLFAYGSTTYRQEPKKRGFEADESYSRGALRSIPDLALEVVVSSPLVDKLDVYAGIGVREVWVYENGRFQILALRGDRYEPIATSEVLPEIDLLRVAHYVRDPDQHAALRAYREEIRTAR